MNMANLGIKNEIGAPEHSLRNPYTLFSNKLMRFQEMGQETMELHLSDLPGEFIVKLSDQGRSLLFFDLDSNLAPSKLGISRSFFYHLKNNRHGFRLSTLKRFAEYKKIPLNEFEPFVSCLISNRGGRVCFIFPIKESASLARLVGHCFGDGNISSKKGEFDYVNCDLGLIDEVTREVNFLFNSKPTYSGHNPDGSYKITFSNLVGKILELAGAPRGGKVHYKGSLPNWIMHGSLEIKKAFLQSLFDDDGSALYSENYRAKNVNLHFTRVLVNDSFFVNYLQDIRVLLNAFGIRSTNPYIARRYFVQNSERIVRGILISRKSGITAFHDSINFTQLIKKNRLERIIKKG
ncbi:hypothetical protein HY989_06710 [Candidatus Micrarchaeota archaeon]|nr:hypothetical protein [Candidatus Micrarchaeota archaeon]